MHPPLIPPTPHDFDDAFLADLPYDPEVLLFDRVLEIDASENRIVCNMPTHERLPLTRAQRAHPVRHPRHVAGAIMVHATGMMGFIHAYYLLGLRHGEGWVGYGTHVHSAKFRKLVEPGEPIEATCRVTRQRLGRRRHVLRYSFAFRHEGALCYEGDQSAVWMLTGDGAGDATELA
jgi:3-hydroxymyristoyl/3-hydroxydecanoyl-(acyl carrier protein) dehydratase